MIGIHLVFLHLYFVDKIHLGHHIMNGFSHDLVQHIFELFLLGLPCELLGFQHLELSTQTFAGSVQLLEGFPLLLLLLLIQNPFGIVMLPRFVGQLILKENNFLL